MLRPIKKYYNPTQYLALEEQALDKHEYAAGEIFAMAGGSANHNLIASNVNALLNFGLENEPCQVFTSDMKVLVKSSGLYTYPDVLVVCSDLEFAEGREDTLTNPLVIVEVLSKSTRDYDRGTKFDLYRELPSLEDYVVIDQERVFVEYHHKLADGRWVLTIFNQLQTTLHLQSLDFEMPLGRIYHKVKWSS